jgi:hypothetical protein
MIPASLSDPGQSLADPDKSELDYLRRGCHGGRHGQGHGHSVTVSDPAASVTGGRGNSNHPSTVTNLKTVVQVDSARPSESASTVVSGARLDIGPDMERISLLSLFPVGCEL